MKLREVQRLIGAYIAPSFPELRLSGDMLVRWDGDPIVRGFVFDRSQAHKEMVRLHVFAQPLFVPADVIYLSVAETLGDFLFDDPEKEADRMEEVLRRAEHEGRCFLERVSDCCSLAETMLTWPRGLMDEDLSGEIRAYCLLWSGRADEAAAQLDVVIDQLREFEVESELETLTQVTQIRKALGRSDAKAHELLETWASQTKEALQLVG
ncbi:hypothetical protein BH20ACT16_BH20ACT16_04350 [soil metagenome]|jgi:hypothetical protein